MSNKKIVLPKKTLDIHILGENTTWAAICSPSHELPDWLIESPASRGLAQHDIAHCGIMHANAPFEIVRYDQSGTFMLACLKGVGEILCEGSWKKIQPGHACLLPPWITNAFHCVSGSSWEFVWVRYSESRERNPIVSINSPIFGKFDGARLQSAVQGLFMEAKSESSPAIMSLWSELIHSYVIQFAQPHKKDDRLWKLWRAVESSPNYPWSLITLSDKACMSSEHLRRVSMKEIGRSPMQQVTFIRMEKAARMLLMSEEKIDTISKAVGYESVTSFTAIFKKWMGCNPSEYRL